MGSTFKRFVYSTKAKYAGFGVLFGLMFPLIASFFPDSLLMYVIATAPFVLGSVFLILGIKQENNSELKKSKELVDFYRSALDKFAIVATTDAHGKITFANEKFTHISGYTSDELIGKDHRIVNSKYHTKEFMKDMWKTISSGTIWRGEICNQAKDGRLYWVDSMIVPSLDEKKRITHYTAIRQEITSRKNAEMNLIKAYREQEIVNYLLKIPTASNIPLEKKLRTALDRIIEVPWLSFLSKGGILLAEGDELKLTVSKNLGAKIESMCSSVKCGRCLCGQAFESKKTIHAKCVDEGHENRYDGITPHGHYNVPILKENSVIGVIVVYLPHGHERTEAEVSFLETCADIIGSHILAHFNEVALIQSKNEAEKATKTKSVFLANMSHEIRTPMNGIIGMSNLLLSSVTDPVQVERLTVIQNCGNSLLELINDVLDFSKIEVDKIELEKLPFGLHAAAQEIVELFNTRASEKGIVLSYKTDPNVPAWIIGDVTRFRQILTNLISNALKFTEIGSVEVSSKAKRRDGKLWEIQFSVKDTGIGISENVKAKLFRSFSQVDASTTRRFGGTGLGLAISKGLCEKMGGTIRVESEVGRGSTFTFTFEAENCRSLAQNSTADPFSGIDPDMGKKLPLQILVVEDNRTNQLVAIGLLGKLGYQADIAKNGVEAIACLKKNSYDLILMDCHMPEMDGFEATKKIISMFQAARPKIIALTASTMNEDVDRCFESGMDGFIGKPISISALVETLGACKPNIERKAA